MMFQYSSSSVTNESTTRDELGSELVTGTSLPVACQCFHKPSEPKSKVYTNLDIQPKRKQTQR